MKIKVYASVNKGTYAGPICTDEIEINDNELKTYTDQGKEDYFINQRVWDHVSKRLVDWTWEPLK
ncbi:MAG: DUF7167 family protein [Bacillota bacterium]